MHSNAEELVPTHSPARLLDRLEAIGLSLARRESALALIGLGSAGAARVRLDVYSDLDFFVIVPPGRKAAYLADLGWLTDVAAVAYAFRNSTDGYKILFADGIFCEFAVLTPAELRSAAHADAQVVWSVSGFDAALAGEKAAQPLVQEHSLQWMIGEALTNLYVGLLRDHRGETLSAMRFIQGYAVERLLEIADRSGAAGSDLFGRDRRIEVRHPELAAHLPRFLQGYSRNRESALALLGYLDERFALNAAMKELIQRLCSADR